MITYEPIFSTLGLLNHLTNYLELQRLIICIRNKHMVYNESRYILFVLIDLKSIKSVFIVTKFIETVSCKIFPNRLKLRDCLFKFIKNMIGLLYIEISKDKNIFYLMFVLNVFMMQLIRHHLYSFALR